MNDDDKAAPATGTAAGDPLLPYYPYGQDPHARGEYYAAYLDQTMTDPDAIRKAINAWIAAQPYRASEYTAPIRNGRGTNA